MRRFAIAAFAVLACVPAEARAETLRQQSENTFEAKGLTGVRVENPRGLVRLTASQDGKIHLTAVKESRGASRERAQKLAEQTRVTAEMRGGLLDVRVHYPRSERLEINLWQVLAGDYEHPRFQVKLALEIPKGFKVDAQSTSGDIVSVGIAGAQTLASTSGDVTVQDASGPLKLSSTSGDIEAGGIASARASTVSGDIVASDGRGPLRAHTTSGNLTVRGVTDSLTLEAVSGDIDVTGAPRGVTVSTTSGDILVRGAAGLVRAESASGDVGLRLVDPLKRVDVSTTSGDVTARLLAKAGCTLDLSTSSGTIDVSIPVDLRSATRRALRGKVGDGRVPITLTTASGDVAVRGPRN